jgi:hypothetical protein
VEIARTSAFDGPVESARIENTEWAPDLNRSSYDAGGTFFWRVSSVDDARNEGAAATGSFTFDKGMRIRLSGRPAKGRRDKVTVSVTDYDRDGVRSATVKVSGAGVKKATRKTNGKGVATFTLRPAKKGAITFKITRKGYAPNSGTLEVKR